MNKLGRNELCPCGSGKKYKHCHENKLFAFESQRYVVSVRNNNTLYKIFDIVFNQNRKRQASIIVSFPYVSNSQGLLSVVTFPKNNRTMDKISLEPGGKVTSHRIKYSHWSDGAVHFSQDGKIFSLKKDASDPLTSGIGHIFSVHIKDYKSFPKLNTKKELSSKKVDLDFEIKEDDKDSIKFVAWWYNEKTLHPPRAEYTRIYNFKQDEGIVSTCFALKSPAGSLLNNCVLMLCGRIEHLTDDIGSHLVFIGGFDKKVIAKDLTQDLKFLALMYPAQNYEELKNKLGSVDREVNSDSPQLKII